MTTSVSQSPTRWAVTITRTRQVVEEMVYVGPMPTIDELVDADQTPIEWIEANYSAEGSIEENWEETSSEDLDESLLVELLNEGGDVLDKEVLA